MGLEKITDTARRAGTLGRIAAAARNVTRKQGGEKVAAQRALAGLLADARGIPMKVGQFLASATESDCFDGLARGIEPYPLETIRPEIERALGGPLEAHFTHFEPEATAASLGQVHRATLHTGEEVAVKVRYPDIARAVDAELRLAKLIPGLGPVRTWGFDLDAYKRVLYDDLQTELDYDAERRRQEGYCARMNVGGLVVPRTFPDLSSNSLLVQSWEEGLFLDDIKNWPREDCTHVGLILICTLFQSLFVHGEIHGDPHIGNYRYRRSAAGTPEVVLLDYGCTIPIDPTARLALLKLILGTLENDDTAPMQCFRAMGFDTAKLESIQTVLPALCQVLFEPFTDHGPFSVRHWALGKRVDNLLGELKWWFRSAGPANLLLLMRAFHGLVMQLDALEINLPWQPILFRVVDADLCQAARALQLPEAPDTATFRSLARYLRVQVLEDGRQVVSVTFPATQAAVLEEIVPEDTRAKIDAAGLDLAAIKKRACASGLCPQSLFEFQQGNRRYRVWLE